jgi:hypothetical protein
VTIDGKNSKGKGKKGSEPRERRGTVEHWVPAIWVPDEKAEGCMRCGCSFGWKRGRHHCRLCGRCVCTSCSEKVSLLTLRSFLVGHFSIWLIFYLINICWFVMVLMSTLLIQTFFISHPNSKDILSKPTCACNACYEIAFPLLDSDLLNTNTNSSTITSHRNFPSRLAVPSVPLGLMRHTVSLSSSLPPRNEDTALQNKLVPSLAVAFPMKSVTARLQQVVAEEQNGGMEGGVGRLKRFCWCLSMVTMEEGGSSGSWKENRERSKMMKRGKGLLLEH